MMKSQGEMIEGKVGELWHLTDNLQRRDMNDSRQ